jgi:RNA polymerase sigma-70 factor, ECF subfamily
MNAMSNPAASFEPYRRRMLRLAYRMLASIADAEDAVQETYLRWHAADRDNVSHPRAFLMTTTTRSSGRCPIRSRTVCANKPG